MVSAAFKQKKRSKAVDSLLLVGASLLVVLLGGAGMWIADDYGVGPEWQLGLPVAAIFFAGVGWGYRRRFRSRSFLVFFAVWLLLHVMVFLLVVGYLGFLYYIPAVLLELWIGYTLAILWFGPPPDTDRGIR